MMYKLTHNQEYTIEMLCGEEYQGKNILVHNFRLILTCAAYARANTKRGKKVSVPAELIVLRKQGYRRNAHVMSQNPSEPFQR